MSYDSDTFVVGTKPCLIFISIFESPWFLSFTIPERSRALGVAVSNTPGGDGEAASVSVLSGGIRDVAQVQNVVQHSISLVELSLIHI